MSAEDRFPTEFWVMKVRTEWPLYIYDNLEAALDRVEGLQKEKQRPVVCWHYRFEDRAGAAASWRIREVILVKKVVEAHFEPVPAHAVPGGESR